MNPSQIALENSIGPSFTVVQGESLMIPYGEFQHRMGLQKLDHGSAEKMAQALSGVGGKLRRLLSGQVRGLPIYIGHPDVPGRGAEFPDKRAYGWITSVTAENDGMRLGVRWTPAGRRMIEDGEFLYYSPYWEAEAQGRVIRPVELLSVGLTNNPNIPVPAIANDGQDSLATDEPSESPDIDPIMKKELAALLGKDETATVEDLLAEVKRLTENQKPEESEETQESVENAGDEEMPADTEEVKPEEEEEMAAENDAVDPVAEVRRERVGAAVDALCLAGRVSVADRGRVTDDLLACANDAEYGETLERLRTGTQVLKTKAVTDGLAEDGGAVRAENDLARLKQKRSEMMDAEMAANGGNFNAAWQKLSRANPQLFT